MTTIIDKRIDAHVGSRLRTRRRVLGMSQTLLGKAVGLTFQQIQKYERGANRIGAGRLYQFSEVLDVPVSFFFDDLPADIASRHRGAAGTGGADGGNDQLLRGETLELVEAYYRIGNTALRDRIRNVAQSLSDLDN